MIPIHPEATDDNSVIRWVVPAGTLPVVGTVTSAPGAFGELQANGTLAEITVEPSAVLTRLRDGLDWPTLGAVVRDGLAAALERPDVWRTTSGHDPDQVLVAAVEQVITGPAGDYIRSHGGSVDIVTAHDEQVELLLRGTCAGCPAAGITLHERLEGELRAIHPQLRSIHAEQEVTRHAPRWLTIGRRPAAG